MRRPFAAPNSPARVNLACAAIVFAWLMVLVPLTFWLRPVRFDDFEQFYLGGSVARAGAWADLYPIPSPSSPYNPGLKEDSTARPGYLRLARAAGRGDTERFIQPPPDALLFYPLALVRYRAARWVFIFLSCASAWGVSLIAGRTWTLASGRATWASGAVTLLSGLSYTMYSTLRALNLEPIAALLLGLTLLALLSGRDARGGIALALGGVLKYAAFILLPLAIVMRRLRLLLTALIALAILSVATAAISGAAPWSRFIHDIAPRLDRPYEDTPDQSLQALLMRVTHTVPLARSWAWSARVAGWCALIAVIALLARVRADEYRRRPQLVLAGAAALIAWMLIFAPLVWNKYHVFMFPLWGYLLWEACQSRWRAIVVGVALALEWGPWHSLPRNDLPEPFNSHMLWAAMLILLISAWRAAVGGNQCRIEKS